MWATKNVKKKKENLLREIKAHEIFFVLKDVAIRFKNKTYRLQVNFVQV